MIKRKGKKWVALTAAVVASAAVAGSAHAQSATALLEVLVRKGILTEKEAADLKTDMARENADLNKVQVPGKSTKNLQLYGDLRGRYEYFESGNDAFQERHRFRYRLRVGATATFKDSFEVGFRLTSGEPTGAFGGDPISGNTSFRDNGSKKFVYVDLAYGKWIALNPANPHQSPHWYGSFTVGKMENPFVFSDLIFDSDYTPEGAATQWAYSSKDQRQVFRVNAGGFVLDEQELNSHDPFLLGLQFRHDGTWSETKQFPVIQSSVGLAALSISRTESLNNTEVPNVGRGNTRNALGQPTANFNPVVADASLTFTTEKFPMYPGNFPITIGGDYIFNPAVNEKQQGFSTGVAFGKLGKKKSWQVSYRYRYLEADAWFEEFPDSDFGAFYEAQLPNAGSVAPGSNSGTNLRGHVVRASYSPYDSVALNLTYSWGWLINDPVGSGSNSDIRRVQLDAVWKF